MTINLKMPAGSQNLKPTITVIGVGGAGGNAVNNMISANLEGANFVIANTDAQALDRAAADRVVQLGANITQGLGAGAHPDVGRAAAEEAADEILSHIEGSHMVFITAGMGGGTGTGAAPVVARMAKEQGILTVAVVTKPFHFEGTHRMKLAEMGLEELQKYVDTMIVIPNQNLFRVANEKTTFADAFRMADEVLHSGVRGVTDLMVMPGLINLDFADIRTVMREMGKAMMGTGEAEGDRRAVEAAEAAISNPLLDDVSMKGARGVLINITGGYDMTLFEVDEAANRIRDEVDPDANIIFGSTFNESMEGKMRVSVVATGIDQIGSRKPDTTQSGVTRAFSQRSGRMEAAPVRQEAKPVVAFASSRERRETQPAAYARPAVKAEPIVPPIEMRLPTEEESSRFDFADTKEAQPRYPEEEQYDAEEETQPELFVEEKPPVMERKTSKTTTSISPRAQRGGRQEIRRPVVKEAEEEAEDEDTGFIRRMASRFSHQEEPAPRRTEVASSRSIIEEEEDYLEIPAFLRRQAN